MNVIKRDGRFVEFDINRIIVAIELAMSETINGVDQNLSKRIANDIKKVIESNTYSITVEEIQDIIEDKLMASNRKDVAKQYILYRNNRKEDRASTKKYKLLDDEFISKYKHKPSPMMPLGEFVYYRTYSRYLSEEKMREYWWQTVRRSVEYNCSIVDGVSKEEAQKLFDNMYNLRQFLSGRTMWTGGTDVAIKYPMSNFNCSFTTIKKPDDFVELFYLLMLGCGVGVRFLKEDVNNFPKFRKNYDIIHQDYSPISPMNRDELTSIRLKKQVAVVTIGDSKTGWVDSLKHFFNILTHNDYRHIDTIIFVYDNVRPNGEKLKTFGGTASGHEALKDIFVKIDKVIKAIPEKQGYARIRSIDALDICNIIGEGVVVGGVRRTAEIALFDAHDDECIRAKTELYKNVEGNWITNKDLIHRQMSNNSIFYKEKPTREKLHWQIEQMRFSGEPAFVNHVAGSKRRDGFNGVNPCLIGSTLISTTEGEFTIESLVGKTPYVYCMNTEGKLSIAKATAIWKTKENAKVIKVSTLRGDITCTPEHKIFTTNRGWVEAKDLHKGDKLKGLNRTSSASRYVAVALSGQPKTERIREHRFVAQYFGDISGKVVHHKDGDRLNNAYSNLEILENNKHSKIDMLGNKRWEDCPRGSDGRFNKKEYKCHRKTTDLKRIRGKNWYVTNIEEINNLFDVYDIHVPEVHNFIANNIVVHNCGEILLDSKGLCNLTTVNVMAFVENGVLNKEKLFEAQRLSARAGYRMTCLELEMSEWNNVQQKDKLTGCSLTGWQDMVNAISMTKEDEATLLQELRNVAKNATKEYSSALGMKDSLLVTTIKPEGTLSQLAGVSSGVHYSHSPYYIRRVRINAQDPLVKVCEELGYIVHPEVGQELTTCKTKVVEFPVEAPNGRTKYEVSAIEQLENYKMFMENYVDHNVSITVHVRENEWDLVEQWMWDNWDDVVAVSFLSLDDSFYKLLPYEAITKEDYLERKKNMKRFIPSLISKYEVAEEDFDIGSTDCAGGVCPIR